MARERDQVISLHLRGVADSVVVVQTLPADHNSFAAMIDVQIWFARVPVEGSCACGNQRRNTDQRDKPYKS